MRQLWRRAGQSGAASERKRALISGVGEPRRVVVANCLMYGPGQVMAVTSMMEARGTHDEFGAAIDRGNHEASRNEGAERHGQYREHKQCASETGQAVQGPGWHLQDPTTLRSSFASSAPPSCAMRW